MATIPTWPTLGVGHVMTSSDMTAIQTYVDFLRNVAGGLFFGGQATIQSVPDSADTPITLDAETLDVDGGHSLVTNTARYVAKTAGWYSPEGVTTFAASAAGTYRVAKVRVNGTTVIGQATVPPIASVVIAIPVIGQRTFLNVNDYIELCGRHNTGGGLNTALSDGSSFMRIKYDRPS